MNFFIERKIKNFVGNSISGYNNYIGSRSDRIILHFISVGKSLK